MVMVDLQKAHKYLYSLQCIQYNVTLDVIYVEQNILHYTFRIRTKLMGVCCVVDILYSITYVHNMSCWVLLCFIVALRTKENWDWELFEHNIVLYE